MTEWRIIRPNPANTGGARSMSAIEMILVHCTEGPTAAGAAGWWARPVVVRGTEGSAHVVFDDTTSIRAVDDDQVAYGAFGYNSMGLHIELAGFAAWSRDTWLSHQATLQKAAAFQAAGHKEYGVPFAWSTVNGYHSHRGLPGNDHTDPGANFPWDVYTPMVRGYLLGQIAQPKPRPLLYGDTLRVQLTEIGKRKPYVDRAGWVGCLPALRALARTKAAKLADKEAIFTWRGNVWRCGGRWGGHAADVLPRVRTVLNNYGPKE